MSASRAVGAGRHVCHKIVGKHLTDCERKSVNVDGADLQQVVAIARQIMTLRSESNDRGQVTHNNIAGEISLHQFPVCGHKT